MNFLASIFNFLSLSGTESACHIVILDEPEMPKSMIER